MKKSFPVKKGTDTVPIMATPGEFVMNRGAVAAAGKPFLDALNELGKTHPAMMQEGGDVRETSPKKKTFPVRGPQQFLQGGGRVQQSGIFGPQGFSAIANLPNWTRFVPYLGAIRGLNALAGLGGRGISSLGNQIGSNKGGRGTNTAVPAASGSDDDVVTLPKVIVKSGNPPSRPSSPRWAIARADPSSVIGSGTFAGENMPTSFESPVGGLFGAFEGGIPGGFGFASGMASSGIGGGGMGPPSIMRYLQEGGEVPEEGKVVRGIFGQPDLQVHFMPSAIDTETGKPIAPGAFLIPAQERPEGYPAAMKYPGILQGPTMDVDVAQATGTFEFDGKHYLLPTQIGGQKLSKEEAALRFRQTGEHLGVFSSDKDAQAFEKSFLNYVTPPAQSKPSATPQGLQRGGMVRGLAQIFNPQNRIRQQHFAHLASRNPPVFQPKAKARSTRRSPFAMRG